MTSKNRYSVEPGRHIHRDGQPFIYIDKCQGVNPTEADDLVHLLCAVMNEQSGKVNHPGGLTFLEWCARARLPLSSSVAKKAWGAGEDPNRYSSKR
jgi:hypothetical protein